MRRRLPTGTGQGCPDALRPTTKPAASVYTRSRNPRDSLHDTELDAPPRPTWEKTQGTRTGQIWRSFRELPTPAVFCVKPWPPTHAARCFPRSPCRYPSSPRPRPTQGASPSPSAQPPSRHPCWAVLIQMPRRAECSASVLLARPGRCLPPRQPPPRPLHARHCVSPRRTA